MLLEQAGVLPEKECVEITDILLPGTYSHSGWMHRVDDECRPGVHNLGIIRKELEIEVAILPPGGCESLVKASDTLQIIPANEAVGGNKAGK